MKQIVAIPTITKGDNIIIIQNKTEWFPGQGCLLPNLGGAFSQVEALSLR